MLTKECLRWWITVQNHHGENNELMGGRGGQVKLNWSWHVDQEQQVHFKMAEMQIFSHLHNLHCNPQAISILLHYCLY